MAFPFRHAAARADAGGGVCGGSGLAAIARPPKRTAETDGGESTLSAHPPQLLAAPPRRGSQACSAPACAVVPFFIIALPCARGRRGVSSAAASALVRVWCGA